MTGIVMAAAELKLAAPREYEKFLEAMKAFEQRTRDDFQAAEFNVIFLAQGKSQLVTLLYNRLVNCLDLRAKFEARK